MNRQQAKEYINKYHTKQEIQTIWINTLIEMNLESDYID